MKITSLSNLTNMIFAKNEGEIIERESYVVIKTIKNPTFHWGNYLIFKHAPGPGDIEKWINIFRKEFSFYKTFDHYVFTWDDLKEPQSPEYLLHHFSLEESVSLSTSILSPPKHYNKAVEVRLITTDKEWDEACELQISTRDPKFSYVEYREFKVKQDESYKKLIRENRGGRFCAFLGNKLVADLGVYFEGEVARYQSVVTHPDHRGKGICGTLVYEAGKYALENWDVKKLCMEADPGYHAARIYESVGFRPIEHSYALYWYKNN